MRKEYRVQTNILMKIFPFAVLTVSSVIYISSMISFVQIGNISYSIMFSVFMVFFIVFSRNMYLLYVKNIPLIILEEEKLIIFTHTGIKDLFYKDITDIQIKKKYFSYYMIVTSLTTSPLRIKHEKLDEDPEIFYNIITELYEVKKQKDSK